LYSLGNITTNSIVQNTKRKFWDSKEYYNRILVNAKSSLPHPISMGLENRGTSPLVSPTLDAKTVEVHLMASVHHPGMNHKLCILNPST
jgi:hypothetical protein